MPRGVKGSGKLKPVPNRNAKQRMQDNSLEDIQPLKDADVKINDGLNHRPKTLRLMVHDPKYVWLVYNAGTIHGIYAAPNLASLTIHNNIGTDCPIYADTGDPDCPSVISMTCIESRQTWLVVRHELQDKVMTH